MSVFPNTAQLAKDRAIADATLIGMLTGGIYLRRELGRHGLRAANLTVAAVAYEGGKLKPTMLISVQSGAAFPMTMRDADMQYSANRDVLEFWFYQHGDLGHDVLHEAMGRVYQLFEQQPVTGTENIEFMSRPFIDTYDERLQDAAFCKSEYLCTYPVYGVEEEE